MKHISELEFFNETYCLFILFVNFFLFSFTFLSEFEQDTEVVVSFLYILVSSDPALHVTHLTHDDFTILRVIPKTVGIGLFV